MATQATETPVLAEQPATSLTAPTTEAAAQPATAIEDQQTADAADTHATSTGSTRGEILILGSSYAGISVAHYFLKHELPKLQNNHHITLVDPSTKFYARTTTSRAVASHKLMPPNKSFLDIQSAFNQYPAEQFTFVQGEAIELNQSTKTVTIALANGGQQQIQYDGLVIATGTKTRTPLFGLQGQHDLTEKAQDDFQAALGSAKKIVLAGGGPAAVETAGELGELLNGKPGMFKTVPKNVDIQIITSAPKLLPHIKQSVADKAAAQLKKLGVSILYNTQVTDVVYKEGAANLVTSPATLTLANGEKVEADLYIPATGVDPNTSFLPASWRTERGHVNANVATLRVDEAGPGVFTVGDVSSAAKWGVMDIYSSVPVVCSNLRKDLEGAAGPDRKWKQNMKEMQMVAIGSKQGTGSLFGVTPPSKMVAMIKGKDLFASNAPTLVNGEHWKKESKWNGK